MDKYLWKPLYVLFFAFATLPLLMSLRAIYKKLLSYSGKSMLIWGFLVSCVILNVAAMLYATISGVSGPHGRYLFPSELAILALLLGGYFYCSPRWGALLATALTVFCACVTIGSYLVFYR